MSVRKQTAAVLVDRIFALQRVLRCVTAANLRASDPGVALQGVLRIIGDAGECRATELASRLGVGASALSRHIAELEELDLVVRRPDPADRRAHLISLSDQGAQQVLATEQRRSELLQQALEGWSEEEADAAALVIERLSRTMNSAFRAKAAGAPHEHTHDTLVGAN